MRRQSGIGKVDKFKMKQLIQQLIPAFFFQPTTDISDDEPDNDDGTTLTFDLRHLVD
jgi:hypothetical protein